MGHSAASAYMGEGYEKGLGGLKKDREKARKRYEAALAGGFSPASQMLANILEDAGSSIPHANARPSSSKLEAPLTPILVPAGTVWENGIPETIPVPDRLILTEQNLALLLLKHHPDQVTQPIWEGLLRRQVDDDSLYYYKRWHDKSRNSLEWGINWNSDINKGYHPKYIPFSPAEFFPEHLPEDSDLSDSPAETVPDHLPEGSDSADFPRPVELIKSDPVAMESFKQWTVARAALSPSVFVLWGSIGKFGNNNDAQIDMNIDGFSFGGRVHGQFVPDLIKRGMVPSQILMGSAMERASTFR